MSLIRIPASCLLFFFLFFSPAAKGQPGADDSIYYHEAISNAKDVYLKNIGSQAAWMNGRINVPYNYTFEKGDPYYKSSAFINSTLIYEGISYPGTPLLYDELKSKLVAFGMQGRIELPSEQVDGFIIDGIKFIHVRENKNINPGYYQVLYAGKLEALKKNKKELREDLVSGTGIVRSIYEKNVYFLRKDNVYYPVHNKKDLLKILKDQNREIQQFIKKEKLKWKNDAERLIAEVAAYYDQLTK
jgi:hypothetical protein